MTPLAERELLVITGMSGAGRSTAADVLEDLGWYVVDNLPPQLLAHLVRLWENSRDGAPRLAIVVDIRAGSFFASLREALDAVRGQGLHTRVVFLDATDDALVRRFESTRRPHPLQAEGGILDGIRSERAMLAELRARAETVVDTSGYNIHQLTRALGEMFGEEGTPQLRITLMSFGFKYGLPMDADHVTDVRFLPNPFWVPELRPLTGGDEPVRSYVMAQPGAREFITCYARALEPVLAGYVRENKRHVTIAVGCTGGKHRSVAMVGELQELLTAPGVAISVRHRDLGRE